MKTSPRGIRLIQSFEGLRLTAYEDVVNVWTIGYGHTGPDVEPDQKITKARAAALLREDLDRFEDGVTAACRHKPNQNQFDALVCFAYNVGLGALKKSTVLRCHNAGDHQAAGRAFGLWNKAGGKVWPGLTRRRAAEAALYLEPLHDDVSEPAEGPIEEMPQAVDSETSLLKSPIIQSTIGGATTGVSILAGVAGQAQTAKTSWDILAPLLPYLPYIAMAVILIAAGVVIWQRAKQRRHGWA